MNADLEALLSEREQAIARLRQTFRFSEQEAIDFLDRFGGEAPAVTVEVSRTAKRFRLHRIVMPLAMKG